MKGKHWETVENIQHHVTTFLKSIPVEEFQGAFQAWQLLPYGSCDPQLAIIVDTDMDLTCFCQGFHRSLGTLSLVPLRPFSCGVKSGFVVVSSIGTSSSSREVLALAQRWNPGVSLRKCRSQYPWLQGLLGDLQFVFPNLPSISTKMPRGKLGKTKTSGGNKIYFRQGQTMKSREKVNDDQHTGRPRSFRCEENKLKIKELIKSDRRIIFRDWTICLCGDNECALKDLKDGKTMTGYFTSVMRGRTQPMLFCSSWPSIQPYRSLIHPYSPDLAPNDFFLYPKLKMNLKGRKFDNVDMIQAESKATLRNLSKSDFISCFDNWKKRWNGCIEAGRAYFEKY
ncbi:hypothetical protein LAZ67_1003712 [Cordylochernes scorpioides]|uniref:Uncharacterized protein n=1 Tax=Cordylochernes scorpioides TaxID=51811 RepID=A0ABY6K011_9ARAC|nr:hypothetical protein LAZ67_1003712 [Cordylochernes scorpioides]